MYDLSEFVFAEDEFYSQQDVRQSLNKSNTSDKYEMKKNHQQKQILKGDYVRQMIQSITFRMNQNINQEGELKKVFESVMYMKKDLFPKMIITITKIDPLPHIDWTLEGVEEIINDYRKNYQLASDEQHLSKCLSDNNNF